VGKGEKVITNKGRSTLIRLSKKTAGGEKGGGCTETKGTKRRMARRVKSGGKKGKGLRSGF